jgi:hypothetical protein
VWLTVGDERAGPERHHPAPRAGSPSPARTPAGTKGQPGRRRPRRRQRRIATLTPRRVAGRGRPPEVRTEEKLVQELAYDGTVRLLGHHPAPSVDHPEQNSAQPSSGSPILYRATERHVAPEFRLQLAALGQGTRWRDPGRADRSRLAATEHPAASCASARPGRRRGGPLSELRVPVHPRRTAPPVSPSRADHPRCGGPEVMEDIDVSGPESGPDDHLFDVCTAGIDLADTITRCRRTTFSRARASGAPAPSSGQASESSHRRGAG